MIEGGEEGGDAAGTPVGLAQSVGQPCVVPTGEAILTDGTPCADRDLGAFTGTEVLFNSGVVPYEGPSGNVFDLELSDDIAPGSYPFVCLVHGSFHSGVLEVVDEDAEVPSNRQLGVLTRQEVEEGVEPLEDAFETFRPLRDRVQAFVDRRFNRRRTTPDGPSSSSASACVTRWTSPASRTS